MARTTRGDLMPLSDVKSYPGDVLLIACEDALEEVIVPRMTVAGADLSTLEMLYRDYRPTIVYVDALMTVMGGKIDTHKDAEVRDRIEALWKLGAKYDVNTLATRHLVKGGSDRAIYAGQGSIAFSAVARSELLFGKNPDAPYTEFVMSHSKRNVSKLGPSLRYRIVEERLPGLSGTWPKIDWLGESRRTADDVANWRSRDGKHARARRDAAEWLERYLLERDEPVQPKEALAAGIACGHAERTLQRALPTGLHGSM